VRSSKRFRDIVNESKREQNSGETIYSYGQGTRITLQDVVEFVE
jgi:hypothetical protein